MAERGREEDGEQGKDAAMTADVPKASPKPDRAADKKKTSSPIRWRNSVGPRDRSRRVTAIGKRAGAAVTFDGPLAR